ncbi:uncharacterized protein HD556DRAFT_1482844 [Suillus plorans]|uniref:Cap64 protein n=1 Tax=Suillus plorans TaxID=116603 RepID=A0A9P7ALS5_9AGAM|nr:uncharacterized protein HD556DRAFT_1482844 [Suillus plorans]KAG1792031.1 hypothetical protein HD556DRAFT_1482844 [Suillus plorans]
MQRRLGSGKALARISPPNHRRLTGMGPDSSKHTNRWNQRVLGVTNRIWAIILGFVLLIALSRFILFSNHTSAGSFTTEGLVPKNYLHGVNNPTDNSSEVANPFDFCPVFGPKDDIANKYGVVPLSQSRLHLGSGGRVHRVIHKALLGQPVTISVLGGSISACHAAGDDPLSSTCYPSRFFQWWSSVFPHPASELTNGAMRRTNSGYFGFCSSHHIPENTDLVILEFDVDDESNQRAMEHFELMVRSILDRPDQPAVVILGHFSAQTHQVYGFAGPDHWHNIVAQFYDVPHISVKPILYPSYMANPDLIKPYFADPILANPAGHELITDVLVSYFQSQICAAWSTARGHSYETIPIMMSHGYLPGADTHLFGGVGARKGAAVPEPPRPVDDGAEAEKKHALALAQAESHPIPIYPELRIPPVRINTRLKDPLPFEEVAPFCASANDLVNPVPPSLFYGSGWAVAHPPAGSSPLLTAGYYWYSSLPTSRLRVPIKVGAGDVGIYYLKEPMSRIGEGSEIECWVDDNFRGAVIIGNAGHVSEGAPTLTMIDQFVTRGSHFIECVLLGDEGQSVPPFKIIGVFAT